MRRSISPSLMRPSSTVFSNVAHKVVRDPTKPSSGEAVTTSKNRASNEYKSLERERRVSHGDDEIGGREGDGGYNNTPPVADTSTSSSSSPPPLGGGSVRLHTRILSDTHTRHHSTSTTTPHQQEGKGSQSPSLPISNTNWKSSRDAVTTSVSHGRLLSLRYYLRWYSWWWLRSQCRVEKDLIEEDCLPQERQPPPSNLPKGDHASPSVFNPPPPLSEYRHPSSGPSSDVPPQDHIRHQSPQPTTSSSDFQEDEDVGEKRPSQLQRGRVRDLSNRRSRRSRHRDELLREMIGIVDALLPDRVHEGDANSRSSSGAQQIKHNNEREEGGTRARAEATVEELLTRRREQRMRMQLSNDNCCANPKLPDHHHQQKLPTSISPRTYFRPQTPSSSLLRRERDSTAPTPVSRGRRASSSTKAEGRRSHGGYFFDVPQPSPLFTLHYLPSTPTTQVRTKAVPSTVPPPEPFKVTVPRGPDLRVDRRAESRPRPTSNGHRNGIQRPVSAPSRHRRDPSPPAAQAPTRQAPIITTEASWLKQQSRTNTPQSSSLSKQNDDGAFERYVLVHRIQPGVRASQSSSVAAGGGSDAANYDRVYHHRAELRDVLAGAHGNTNNNGVGEYVYTTTTGVSSTPRSLRTSSPPAPAAHLVNRAQTAARKQTRHNLVLVEAPSNEVPAVSGGTEQSLRSLPYSTTPNIEDNTTKTKVVNNNSEFVVRWDDGSENSTENQIPKKRGGVSGVVERVLPTSSRRNPTRHIQNAKMEAEDTKAAIRPISSRSAHKKPSSPIGGGSAPSSLSLSPDEITAMKAALKVLVKEAREARRRKESATITREPTLMKTHAHQQQQQDGQVRPSSSKATRSDRREDIRVTRSSSKLNVATSSAISGGVNEDPFLKDIHRSERAMKRAVKDLLWRQAPDRRMKEEWGQYIERVIPSAADVVNEHHHTASKALQQRSIANDGAR